MKIAIWWNIPCKSIVPVARQLASFPKVEVTFISETDLSESRKQLGWKLPDFGKAKYIVLPQDEWKEEVSKHILSDYDIHVFNGIYLFDKIRFGIDLARNKNVPFGIISEAYHNPYVGFKRVLKFLYTRTITPFKVCFRAKKALFVLGASGNNVKPFLHLGWKKEQFFPFGYFPENDGFVFDAKTKNKIPVILSTGYITKNKGQYLLIQALSELQKSNVPFKCFITGFGPDEERVKDLANNLGLNDAVEFTGVVDTDKLNHLKKTADLFLAPGYEEPWGIRINEAILAHTPVIVSDGIGACELIRNSEAGRVFKSGDLNSLVKVLKNQLNTENLEVSKTNAELFAPKIAPDSAAHYLLDIINHVLNKTNVKPYPLWLNK
ncbi:glycosyltransferase [Lacinutrix sp. MEBiC02404]